MQPKVELITITDNKEKILRLLQELVLMPRIKALEWSRITKQTPNMKIGYPGQHLASLITGIEGARTGARGDDLRDGTEVKSCSRVDQLDTCKNCRNKVLRIENICPHCGSGSIKRMDDSKWLFSVKSEGELNLLTKQIDRVFLTIADYPYFDDDNFNTIRFQAFEIWNNTDRHKNFATLMTNYYYKLFLEHISIKPSATPAPKNFWPFSYQFYLCNPVKVFSCIVDNANVNPSLKIDYYIEPAQDRSVIKPEPMPFNLLDRAEVLELLKTAPQEIITSLIVDGSSYEDVKTFINYPRRLFTAIPFIDEKARSYIKLRDTDIITESKTAYTRR